jgi:DNA (cytosine-5)-methyltransferase 1
MKAKIRFTVVSEVELNSVSPVASLKEIARIEALAVPALGKAILIRNLPKDIARWISTERYSRRQSQREFVVDLLAGACREEPSHYGADQATEATSFRAGMPFSFADMFAGIGGFRLGLERAGGHSVFSCEWDKYAQKTYRAWFGETPHGDIRNVKLADIPDHDVLAAGFPCQPFSIAGVSKKKSLGRAHGFKDKAQGTLFFHLSTVIEVKRPPVVMLENVKNLLAHDRGRTWEVIKGRLEELKYCIFTKIIDAAAYVPQHRERIFLVCFDRRVFGDAPPFRFPEPPDGARPRMRDILESKVDKKYTLSDHLWKYLKAYAAKHKAKGNGFGYGLVDMDGISRTLSARYYKDGSEVLIPQGRGRNPRRLTPREAARLMGFNDDLPIVVSDTQAYRQFGNAVVPKITGEIAGSVAEVLRWHLRRHGSRCLVKR